MLNWDIIWNKRKNDVLSLGNSQKHAVALASIEDSIDILGDSFRRTLRSEISRTITASLDILWTDLDDNGFTTNARDVIAQGMESFIDVHEVAGSYDICMGLAVMLRADNLRDGLFSEVMSYAYQAVLDQQILSPLPTETSETALQKLEQANPVCVLCVSNQMQLLDSALRGERFVRRTVLTST